MSEGASGHRKKRIGNCEWCGMPAYHNVQLKRGVAHSTTGPKLPKLAKCCDEHATRFEMQGAKVISEYEERD